MVKKTSKKISKSKLITFVHYREHGNQRKLADYLGQINVPFAISPCHKADIGEDGKKLKPHYHVILIYDGPTTKNNVITNIIQPLGDPLYCEFVQSLKGIESYLTHSNNPEKVQYNPKKIIYSSNYKIATISHQDRGTNLIKILNIINEQDIKSIYELINYFLKDNDFTSIDFISSRTYFYGSFINSRNSGVRGKKLPLNG